MSISVSPDRNLLRRLVADPAVTDELCAMASEVRRQVHGNVVHLRGIVEFSNHCRGTCRYCGINRGNLSLPRYCLPWDRVFDAARAAVEAGCPTVVLQSGEAGDLDIKGLAGVISRIRRELDAAVTVSCGEWPREVYQLWREAGADRYLIKLETANRDLYARLHPGMSYDNRRRCHQDLFDLGYQVGSGDIVGLPGQTADHLVDDLLDFATWPYDMISIGPLVPAKGAPLEGAGLPDPDLVLRMIALTRILAPKAHLPAATALCSLGPNLRARTFKAGVNVWMPNFTPGTDAREYAIYDRAACRDRQSCAACLAEVIRSNGLVVSTDKGHGIRRAR